MTIQWVDFARRFLAGAGCFVLWSLPGMAQENAIEIQLLSPSIEDIQQAEIQTPVISLGMGSGSDCPDRWQIMRGQFGPNAIHTGAAYVPGTDAKGHPVAPADVNQRVHPLVASMTMTLDVADRMPDLSAANGLDLALPLDELLNSAQGTIGEHLMGNDCQ